MNKYCVKITMIGDDSMVGGEPRMMFYKERPEHRMGLIDPYAPQKYVNVPYEYPTTFDTKVDVITRALELQQIMDDASNIEAIPERAAHIRVQKMYFFKACIFDWDEVVRTEMQMISLARSKSMREVNFTFRKVRTKVTSDEL